MKRINILLIALLSPIFMWAQQGINYQAVVRDGAGAILVNQNITAGFEIEETTAGGTVVYSENHTVTTNNYGLINVIIGEGTVLSGDFATIDWGSDKFFVAVSIDGNAMGTTEFKWVPYSLHAQTLTNIKTNTSLADVDMSSTDEEATISLTPTGVISDSSTIFLTEGTGNYGMKITYNGEDNNLNISGDDGLGYNGPHLSIERDSGTSTFSKGVVVDETTINPEPNTTYGNSGPIAYGYISGSAVIITQYGIASATVLSTGVYEITLDNDWVGSPAVICTSLNGTSDTEIVTYTVSGTNTVTVRIVDETNTATTSNFSFVVYGVAQ